MHHAPNRSPQACIRVRTGRRCSHDWLSPFARCAAGAQWPWRGFHKPLHTAQRWLAFPGHSGLLQWHCAAFPVRYAPAQIDPRSGHNRAHWPGHSDGGRRLPSTMPALLARYQRAPGSVQAALPLAPDCYRPAVLSPEQKLPRQCDLDNQADGRGESPQGLATKTSTLPPRPSAVPQPECHREKARP